MNTYRSFATLSLAAIISTVALGAAVTPVHAYEYTGYAGTNGGFSYLSQVSQDISGPYAFDDTATAPSNGSETAWTRRQGSISSTKAWLKVTTGTTSRSSCSSGNSFNFVCAYGHMRLDYTAAIHSLVWWDNVIVRVSDLDNSEILFDKEGVTETGSVNLACIPGHTIQLYIAINQNNLGFGYPEGGTSFRAEGTLTPYSVSSGLYVKSLNPASGVTITAISPDLNGKSIDQTSFGMVYDTGSSTTLIAPATTGVNAFNHWQLDGVDQAKGLTNVTVAFTVAHGSRTAIAIYDPAPAAVRCSPSSTVGGTIVNGILALSGFPTTGGMTVNVMSDMESVAKPQVSSVSIPSSSNQGFFKITTYPVNATTNVTITAYTALKSVTTTLIVTPPTVLKLALIPGTVNGGMNTTMYVYLNGKPASNGITVDVGSGNASLAKPTVASVVFPQGTTVKAVPITSAGVDSATPVTLNASIGGGAQTTTTLTLNPATVASVYFPPPSAVYGGNKVNGLVYLSGKAGPSGLTLNLSSENLSLATVPATVKAPAQASAVAFTATTFGVDSTDSDEINAWLDPAAAKSTMLTVNPAVLSKLSIHITTMPDNYDNYGAVTLNGAAGPSGIQLTFSTDPSGVLTVFPDNGGKVPAGLKLLYFDLDPLVKVTKATVITVTVQIGNGPKMSVPVTVNPS